MLGKEDDSKFRKEFFGLIIMISRGKRIQWSKVISDTIANQVSSMDSAKRFYMNSYLVYLLLDGKERPLVFGDKDKFRKGTYPVWQCYPKWKIERRWSSFFMRNDGWEYEIDKEIKAEVTVQIISNRVARSKHIIY